LNYWQNHPIHISHLLGLGQAQLKFLRMARIPTDCQPIFPFLSCPNQCFHREYGYSLQASRTLLPSFCLIISQRGQIGDHSRFEPSSTNGISLIVHRIHHRLTDAWRYRIVLHFNLSLILSLWSPRNDISCLPAHCIRNWFFILWIQIVYISLHYPVLKYSQPHAPYSLCPIWIPNSGSTNRQSTFHPAALIGPYIGATERQ